MSTVTHKGTNGAVVDTTSYTRDANGNVTHADLPGGGQFNYAYDARNRLTQVQQLKAAAPAAQWITVSYGYDNLNRQVLTTDGLSNQWLTTYNTLGLVQDQIEPSTAGQTDIGDRRFTSIYNAAGLVTNSIQPANVQVNYTYDELARVVLESAAVTAVSAAGTASFGYDAAGRMTSFSAPQGDVSLTYDDRNLLVSASGEGVASSFTYDAAGRMTKRTVAAGESQYQWDVAGRLVADTEPLTNTTRTYTWNTANQVTGVSYSAGGMQRAYTYDTAGRLVSDTLTGDNITQRQSQYGYDGAGRLASETISGTGSVVGQGVNSYTYDTAGRLVSWTAPSATTTSYGWDDNGNRTSNGAVTSTYDARNRLTGSSNGDSYTWSARGTMVSQTVGGQTSEYSFDGLGRMTSAAGVGVHYDALDRLAERSDGNGGWVQFSYSGTGLQPVSDGASLIARSPSGDPVAVKTGTAPGVSVVADRHGDVVATFNPTAGTIQGSIEFDPFGQSITTSGVQAGSVGYQGSYTDPTNGLIDMGARWYQPTTGRFTARDTIRPMLQSPISLNMYTYANDDPFGFFDPDGHQPIMPLTPDGCERTTCSKQNDAPGAGPKPKPKSTPAKPKSEGVQELVAAGVNVAPPIQVRSVMALRGATIVGADMWESEYARVKSYLKAMTQAGLSCGSGCAGIVTSVRSVSYTKVGKYDHFPDPPSWSPAVGFPTALVSLPAKGITKVVTGVVGWTLSAWEFVDWAAGSDDRIDVVYEYEFTTVDAEMRPIDVRHVSIVDSGVSASLVHDKDVLDATNELKPTSFVPNPAVGDTGNKARGSW